MTVTDNPPAELIFASSAVTDRVLNAEDRYQRKPSGSADQGYRDEN